jgi:hypothetical protein
MGVTGGLVRSIFFRNKSFGAHDYNNVCGCHFHQKPIIVLVFVLSTTSNVVMFSGKRQSRREETMELG